MSAEPPVECIDAALFLGMHATDDRLRLACKAFVIDRWHSRLTISLEQVGRCDDLVWGFGRAVQDAYYPFMDSLHTVLDIARPGYEEADVRRGLELRLPGTLPVHERLLLGMVLNRHGQLITASPRLLSGELSAGLPVRAPQPVAGREPAFPDGLERLYQESLALRVPGCDV
jgi:hypothetical protein